MGRSIFYFCALLISAVVIPIDLVIGQQQSIRSIPQPRSVYPSMDVKIASHSNWAREYYPQRIAYFIQSPLKKGEIVMIGNSITEGGGDWAEKLNNPKVRNRGISGDTSDGVLERLGEIIWCQPPAIFLLIGTNDLFSDNTAGKVAENVMVIATRVSKELPNTTLYVQTVFPQNQQPALNAKVLEINELIKKNQAVGQYKIIDTYELLSDDLGGLKEEYTQDGVHLTAEGYSVWTRHLKKYVSKH